MMRLKIVTEDTCAWRKGEVVAVGVKALSCRAVSLLDGSPHNDPNLLPLRPLDHRTDDVYLDEDNRLRVRPKPPAPVEWEDLKQGDYFTDSRGDLCVCDDEGGYTSLCYADGLPAGVTHDDESYWRPFTRRTPAEAAAIIAGGSPDAD